MKQKKTVKDSTVTMTEMVFPNDTNPLGNLMGGRMLQWMDIAAAISAQKHCNCLVVTVSVDNVSFKQAIPIGDIVILTSKVTRSFNSSMEVSIEVWSENILGGTKVKTNSAYYTFVAVDHKGKPIDVPEILPETEEEIKQYSEALKRRELRLVLAGRMKYSDSKELKALFEK